MDASAARDQVHTFLTFQDSNEVRIPPDYSVEISDPYTVISTSIARSMNLLSILGLVRGAKYPGRLPSGAIDWGITKGTQEKPFHRDGTPNFDACLGYPYRATSPLLECLAVRGKIVGQVAIVSSLTHDSQLPLKEN